MGYFDSIYAAELPHRDVAVYMYLKHRANAEGRCWPSVRTIAKDLNLSRATVQRALRELQQGGGLLRNRAGERTGAVPLTATGWYDVRKRQRSPPRDDFAVFAGQGSINMRPPEGTT